MGNIHTAYSYRKEDKNKKEIKRISFYYEDVDQFVIYVCLDEECMNDQNVLFYDTFFFNLYKSLPNSLGYVSWVNVGNKSQFLKRNDIKKYKIINNAFNDNSFFYHCVTTKKLYEISHTKEQLLNCPFIKVEEWEDGSIEILHYNNPLDIESEENIEQLRKVRKYLSENNLYS